MIASTTRTRFRTRDVDAFRDVVGRVLSPFEITARRGEYDARLEHDRLGDLAFTMLAYGNEVEIEADCMDRFYVLEVPLTGGIMAKSLGPERAYTAKAAHVLNPIAPFRLRMDARCRLLAIRLDKSMLEHHFRALSGGRWDSAPILPESLPLTGERGASFRRWLDFLRGELGRTESLLHTGPGVRQAEQMLFALLLSLVEPEGAEARPERCAPYYVRRAESFIEANLAADIGLVDIVASSGVSVRTLYDGFQRCRGVGPMAWLRQLRLDRVREELSAAAPASTSVTAVASRWGFLHLGRFASSYRARFGESPSETLRKQPED